MRQIWNEIRVLISQQPMPAEFSYGLIDYDDIVESPDGLLKVRDFILCGQLCERVQGSLPLHRRANIPLYDQVEVVGILVCDEGGTNSTDTSSSESRGVVTFPLTALRKNTEVLALCNDCGAKSKTLFHFLGLECAQCHGFNTTQT